MISLLLLVLAILMGMTATRVGAIALEITGLKPEEATFQAQSAFSGVGFTTLESEFVVNHPERRKIIKQLMRYGNAGVITTMATLVGALVSSPQIVSTFESDRLIPWLPINLPVLILLGVIVSVYGLQHFLSTPSVSRLVKEIVTQWLVESHLVEPIQFKEIGLSTNGYGIIQVDVCERNPLLGKTLGESQLDERDITVLNVDKLSESIVSPSSNYRVELGDRLVCYGPMSATKKNCCAIPSTMPQKKTRSLIEDEPLAINSLAPDFTLRDQFGNTFKLSDYKGKKNVILVFYPKDHSFTCTAQLRKFGDHPKAFDDLDTIVVAINPESAKQHASFGEKLHIDYPILTDPDKKVCKAYRSLMLGGLLVNRTVYAVDKEGRIVYAERGNPSIHDVIGSISSVCDLRQSALA